VLEASGSEDVWECISELDKKSKSAGRRCLMEFLQWGFKEELYGLGTARG
jgi:hypothetical protein